MYKLKYFYIALLEGSSPEELNSGTNLFNFNRLFERTRNNR